jgi:septal ring factor EnvC (AmiA/AmiB activator)
MMRLAWAFALCVASGFAHAEGPQAAAAQAQAMLNQAAAQLQAAGDARDRVKALTTSVKAYEAGLRALRDGVRQASIRERVLDGQLRAKKNQLADMLVALQAMQTVPDPLVLLHPDGPLATAQAGMIMADFTPALRQQAEALRIQLEEIAVLRLLQETAAAQLRDGMAGAQAARAALSQAIGERRRLPADFMADQVGLRALLESSDTLASFTEGLSELDAPETSQGLRASGQTLSLPVAGTVLRSFNQADAAGITRPGWIIASTPRALVSAPWAASVRYVGPLLDYGNVIILEPDHGFLIVLAGLGDVYVQAGQIVTQAAPLGLMGGDTPVEGEFLALANQAAGTDRSQTLYIEVRDANKPVDPAKWFDAGKG